jgi:hypothetical protein
MCEIAAVIIALALGGDSRIDAEVCGRNALGIVAAYHRARVTDLDLEYLDRLLPNAKSPFSFADLKRASETIGLEAHLVHWRNKNAVRLDCAAILRVRAQPGSPEADHFIACFGAAGDGIVVADFPGATTTVPRDRLFDIWDGEMLYVEPRPATVIAQIRAQERWRLAGIYGATALVATSILAMVARWRITRRKLASDQPSTPPGYTARLSARRMAIVVGGLGAGTACVLTYLYGWRHAEAGASRSPLVAAPELLLIEPKDANEEIRTAAFELKNVGDRPITIDRVTSKCTCMAVQPLDGVVLAPGATTTLDLKIVIPRMGSEARVVQVFHDAASKPLLLQVRVHGSRPLPFISRKINATPLFADLALDQSAQTVRIETLEAPGSPPWLSELTCDSADVTVEFAGMTEMPDSQGTAMRRKYSWTAGWRKLPVPGEFSFMLWLTTGAKKRMPIGQVFARVSGDALFSPNSVYLQRAGKERELVMATRVAGDRDWRIADGYVPPSWLTVAPTVVSGRKAFQFGLSGIAASQDSATESVPLVDARGEKCHLRVAAQFQPRLRHKSAN